MPIGMCASGQRRVGRTTGGYRERSISSIKLRLNLFHLISGQHVSAADGGVDSQV